MDIVTDNSAVIATLEARIALLEAKNREALAVIEMWDAVYAKLNIKDAKKLGKFKADIVAERIALLEAAIREILTVDRDINACHDLEQEFLLDEVQAEAYRKAAALLQEQGE